MSIIYLILIYAIICFCMILFNVFSIFVEKSSNKINSYKVIKMKEKIKEQFQRIEDKVEIEEEHLKYLKRKLKKGNQLMIFDSIVTSYQKRENPYVDRYLEACREVFIYLMYRYVKKNSTESAYYLSVVRDYNIFYKNDKLEIDSILFEALQDKNFYYRENAYLSICKMGDPKKMVHALLEISSSSKFFHQSIISNGLNIYNNDQQKLLKLLMKNFDSFRNDIKSCIIEFASYYDGDYNEFILELLSSKDTDKNIRISCLNYFGVIFYALAEDVLVSCVEESLKSDFSICYAAVKALRNYNTRSSVRAIKKAIYSDNFKIKDVACESLAVIRLGLNASELDEFASIEELNDMYYYHVRKNMKKTVK